MPTQIDDVTKSMGTMAVDDKRNCLDVTPSTRREDSAEFNDEGISMENVCTVRVFRKFSPGQLFDISHCSDLFTFKG